MSKRAPSNTALKKRAKPGKPEFVPTEGQRNAVTLMVAGGMTHERIRFAIINEDTKAPISKDTLEKVFRRELDEGQANVDAIVLGALMANVRKGNMTAIIWYQKNRMGWTDASPFEGGGGGGGQHEQRVIITGGLPQDWEKYKPTAEEIAASIPKDG